MVKIIHKASAKIGLHPGALVHIGKKRSEKVRITIIDYDKSKVQEKKLKKITECIPFKNKSSITWINVDGIHQPEIVKELGECFDIHPLVLEDVVNEGQRPKVDDFGKYMYTVLKMLYRDRKGEIISEQVSIILGRNYVISFQEQEGDVFDAIRDRIRKGKGRVRGMSADYLANLLIDAIVDNYFVVLESIAEKIE